jgi:hypothetical protein
LVALGHEVKQVPPAFAKPFRQGHKNDFRDAHAIAEAVQRPSTRCVPIKTDDQGARAIQLHPASWAKRSFGPWLTAAAQRLHCNVLTVALANKLARIALTILVQGRNYETRIRPVAA